MIRVLNRLLKLERIQLGGRRRLNLLWKRFSGKTRVAVLQPSSSMSSLPVIAEVSSKLHADIAIIRLLRAGIHVDQISAAFPSGRAPNTVSCWLNDFRRVPVASQSPVSATGLLGRLFGTDYQSEDFDEQLDALGLSVELAARLVEKMEDGRIILCVHARNEAEATVAWHIYEHVAADHVATPTEFAEHAPNELAASSTPWAVIAA